MGHRVGHSLSPHGQGSARSSPSSEPTGASAAAQGWKACSHPRQCVLEHWQQGRWLHPPPTPDGAISTAALWIYVKTLCMWPCDDFRREVHLIFIRCLRLWFYKLMEHMSAKAPKAVLLPLEVTGRCIACRDLVWKTCAPPCALHPLQSPDFYWIQLLLIIL